MVQRFDDNDSFRSSIHGQLLIHTHNFGSEEKNIYGDLACILANRFLNSKSLCL